MAYAQSPTVLDVSLYRTPISPGTVAEDAQFLTALIPQLARGAGLAPADEGRPQYETVELEINRRKKRNMRGEISLSDRGRPVIAEFPRLVIQGENFMMAAKAFLEWRKRYEEAWIQSASEEGVLLNPTPLQQVFNGGHLTRQQKVQQTINIYRTALLPSLPVPTPNPDYWPISDVINLPDAGAQIQFYTSAHKVVVLDASSSRVWMVPLNPTEDPVKWREVFEKLAKKEGLEKAVKIAIEEATKWRGPEIVPPKRQ
jgi:hypothetical protein